MPNRIIKESLCTSDRISALSDFEFRLWIGLITQADDAGRGDARPAIIKGRVFPLRDRVSLKDIDCALHGLAAKGCVSLYEIDGKPYFLFPTWGKHQRVRDIKPKFPAPTDQKIEETEREENTPFFSDLEGLPQFAADCGFNPIQSNTNPNTESESNPNTDTPPTPPSRAGVVDVLFQLFWQAYPKKKGKAEALKAFKKLKVSQALLDKMLQAIQVQKKSKEWTKDGGQFIPYPSTWLNRGQWEDEVTVEVENDFETTNPFLAMLYEMEQQNGEEPIYADFTEGTV